MTSGGSFLLTVLTAFFFFSIIRGQWKLLFSERGRGNDLLSVAPSVWGVWCGSRGLWFFGFIASQTRRTVGPTAPCRGGGQIAEFGSLLTFQHPVWYVARTVHSKEVC